MENIQTNPGASGGSVVVTRSITREMVYDRTLELASVADRSFHQIKQVDYEQAKRELTGETDFDRQQAILDFWEYKLMRTGSSGAEDPVMQSIIIS